MEAIEFLVNVPVTNRRLNELFAASSAAHRWKDFEAALGHSLGFVCAYSGGELIGFVNLAWDGGIHAFVLDPTVLPSFRGRGIGRRLVSMAVRVAEEHRIEWVHVDFEPQLRGFYQKCGFRPTEAGLVHLAGDREGS